MNQKTDEFPCSACWYFANKIYEYIKLTKL